MQYNSLIYFEMLKVLPHSEGGRTFAYSLYDSDLHCKAKIVHFGCISIIFATKYYSYGTDSIYRPDGFGHEEKI